MITHKKTMSELLPNIKALHKRGYLKITEGYFFSFLIETVQMRGHNMFAYVVIPHLNRLDETVLMRGHIICFH